MTRHSIFQKLIRLIGRKNTARLQMAVKLCVTFRKVYTADSKTHGNESFISPLVWFLLLMERHLMVV